MTNPVSPMGVTTPKEAVSAKESTLGNAKSETAKAVLAQDQYSEQAAREATLDQKTSNEPVGGSTTDQHASASATKNVPNQTTSEEAVGETEPIQIPVASCADKQTTEASPIQGATAQQAPDQLTGRLSTLTLRTGPQVKAATPGKRVEVAGWQRGEWVGWGDRTDWAFSHTSFPSVSRRPLNLRRAY